MTITYEFEITALCPNEPHVRNVYKGKLESTALIWTEQIEEWVDRYANTCISQEALTNIFAADFPGVRVTLVGQHGRVQITSTAQGTTSNA